MSTPTYSSLFDDRAGRVERIARALSVDEAMLDASPYALIGSPARIIEDLLALRADYGFSYVIVGAGEIESFAPVVAELAGN